MKTSERISAGDILQRFPKVSNELSRMGLGIILGNEGFEFACEYI